MQWYKHDSYAYNDAKIKKLIIRYGTDGYAIYFHCLELINGCVEAHNMTFRLEHDSEIIADNLRVKSPKANLSASEYVEEIMRYMVELRLFEDNAGIITCFKLLRRLDTSMTSNPTFRALINNTKDKLLLS